MLKLGLNFNTPPFIQPCAHLRIIFDVFLFTRGDCSDLAMQRQTHGNIGVSWSEILFYTLHTEIFSSASREEIFFVLFHETHLHGISADL